MLSAFVDKFLAVLLKRCHGVEIEFAVRGDEDRGSGNNHG